MPHTEGTGYEHGWSGISAFELELSEMLGPLMQRHGIELTDAEWNAVCAIVGHHLAGGDVAYSGLAAWLKRIGTHTDFGGKHCARCGATNGVTAFSRGATECRVCVRTRAEEERND